MQKELDRLLEVNSRFERETEQRRLSSTVKDRTSLLSSLHGGLPLRPSTAPNHHKRTFAVKEKGGFLYEQAFSVLAPCIQADVFSSGFPADEERDDAGVLPALAEYQSSRTEDTKLWLRMFKQHFGIRDRSERASQEPVSMITLANCDDFLDIFCTFDHSQLALVFRKLGLKHYDDRLLHFHVTGKDLLGYKELAMSRLGIVYRPHRLTLVAFIKQVASFSYEQFIVLNPPPPQTVLAVHKPRRLTKKELAEQRKKEEQLLQMQRLAENERALQLERENAAARALQGFFIRLWHKLVRVRIDTVRLRAAQKLQTIWRGRHARVLCKLRRHNFSLLRGVMLSYQKHVLHSYR